jgi:UbiA prenyltransferase family
MKVPSILRSSDWWDYKIIPLLFVGYMTTMLWEENLLQHIGWLLFLIAAISAGAIYVSIINDFTDLKFDMASGKTNRLEHFSPLKRRLILTASILVSISFCCFFINDWISLTFYLMAYLSFSLYSIDPFRLKNRGVLGVIADASGAHLFPSLFIVASITHRLNVEIDPFWMSIIGVWAFSYGLRGILWHQFWDRENDLSINHQTFATKTSISAIKPIEKIISAIEISALLLILVNLGKLLPFVALLFYVFVLFGYRKLKYELILILSGNQPWHILMSDYYEVLLPYSLIITCSIQHPWCLLLFLFHLLFFPSKPIMLAKNLLMMLNSIKKDINRF